MRTLLLADRIPWFGSHSGYEQLARHLSDRDPGVHVVRAWTSQRDIRIGRLYCRLRGWSWREDYVPAAAELRMSLAMRRRRFDIRHVLYGEHHHTFLGAWRRTPKGLIATLHHPPEQWPQWHPSLPDNLKRLGAAIVLYRRDLEHFDSLMGGGRVHFIPHGVDTAFFRPGAAKDRSILFAGQNGRNMRMLGSVVRRLAERHPDLRFDLLVRKHIRQFPGVRDLIGHPAVRWHQGLDDEGLLQLYQRSLLMLLPLDCAGAVNALVESLACGLPVVTTDVGGVPDYGGGTVFPVVENDADDAMIDLVERYLEDEQWRSGIASRCRNFATSQLAWPLIAARHVDLYEELIR